MLYYHLYHIVNYPSTLAFQTDVITAFMLLLYQQTQYLTDLSNHSLYSNSGATK